MNYHEYLQDRITKAVILVGRKFENRSYINRAITFYLWHLYQAEAYETLSELLQDIENDVENAGRQ